MIASIPKRFALVTKSVITLVAGFGLFVAASLVPAGIAAAEDGDWRWPGPPQGRCAESAPAAHLDVYVEGSREPVGLHRLRRCDGEAAEGRVASLVDSRFRFTKRFPLWPDFDVAVDHQRAYWHRGGKLIRAVSLSRGDAACRRLFYGECRMELRPTAQRGEWTFFRKDTDGVWTDLVPSGTVIDDMWSLDITRAPAVANLYTGRIWRIETVDGDARDDVAGRPARRYHIKSEVLGFLFITSRFERVLWFGSDGEVLRVCDFQENFGLDHVSEFVRKDLGIPPRHDCAKWFE